MKKLDENAYHELTVELINEIIDNIQWLKSVAFGLVTVLLWLVVFPLLSGCNEAIDLDDTDPSCTPCEDGLDGFDGEQGPEGPQGIQGEQGAPGCVQQTYTGTFDETGSVLVDIGIDATSPPAMQAWFLALGSDRWRQIPVELLTDGTLSFAGSADRSFMLIVVRCEIETIAL